MRRHTPKMGCTPVVVAKVNDRIYRTWISNPERKMRLGRVPDPEASGIELGHLFPTRDFQLLLQGDEGLLKCVQRQATDYVRSELKAYAGTFDPVPGFRPGPSDPQVLVALIEKAT